MSNEQIERLLKAVEGIRIILLFNVGLGITLAIGLGALSVSLAIRSLGVHP
jgi:hypothetical protein